MSIVKEYLISFLDFIYPPGCVGCDLPGERYICEKCIEQFKPVESPNCNICGHTLKADICMNCRIREKAFTKARGAGIYDGVLRELIHSFKYRGIRVLADDLSAFMYNYLINRSDIEIDDVNCIIPVPIHAARKRIRGYNQSELLAERLSQLTRIPLINNVLIRFVYTNPQVDLSREQRMVNMKSAFRVIKPEYIINKKILLIDDVSTTSSTIYECSKTLLENGASDVQVLCLAFDA